MNYNNLQTIFTIGYSSYRLCDFIKTLKDNKINALADVRSSPYSTIHLDYNRENLQKELKSHGIAYVYLGDLLGARIDDQSVYINNTADFDLIATSSAFNQGLARLIEGTNRGYLIALMCAEKDPIACHRAILICKNLRNTFDIKHILPNFKIESQHNFEKRLLHHFNLDCPDLFGTSDDIKLEHAYKMQERNIAYKISPKKNDEGE